METVEQHISTEVNSNIQTKLMDNEEISFIYLHVDKTDYSKYYQCIKKPREKQPLQSRVYMFLEHPAGWCGLMYHMSVYVKFLLFFLNIPSIYVRTSANFAK